MVIIIVISSNHCYNKVKDFIIRRESVPKCIKRIHDSNEIRQLMFRPFGARLGSTRPVPTRSRRWRSRRFHRRRRFLPTTSWTTTPTPTTDAASRRRTRLSGASEVIELGSFLTTSRQSLSPRQGPSFGPTQKALAGWRLEWAVRWCCRCLCCWCRWKRSGGCTNSPGMLKKYRTPEKETQGWRELKCRRIF